MNLLSVARFLSLPTGMAMMIAAAVYTYDYIDSKGKEHKDALIRRNPGVVTAVDVYGRVNAMRELCVNGVIYFGSPMTLLRDRDDKVVPCLWQELVVTEKDKK